MALALAGPAGAETKAKPQNPLTVGSPSAPAKTTTPDPKLNLDTGVTQPAAGQGATTASVQGAPAVRRTPRAPVPEQLKPKAANRSRRHAAADAAASADIQPGSKIRREHRQVDPGNDGLRRRHRAYNWKVSTGRARYATPSGTYTPTSMNEIWYSKQWDNSPMPHAVFFMKDGHAIHGTHEVKNLGKPASHGCVRLAPENATILYDLVKKNGLENTQVVLSGETPGGEYRAWRRPAPNISIRPISLWLKGPAVARRGSTPTRKPRFSLISSRGPARAVPAVVPAKLRRSGLLCPAAGPTLLSARLRLLAVIPLPKRVSRGVANPFRP